MRKAHSSYRQVVIVFCSLVLLSSSLTACSSNVELVALHFRKTDGSTTPIVNAEIARSPGEIKLGLMYRKEMPASRGMLFIFNRDKPRSFWMKNTYLELDMIFVSSEFKVVSIIRRAVPLSETSRKSDGPAKYVLEVIGGSTDQWGLAKGDQMVVPEGFQ